VRHGYRIGVPTGGQYVERINSDSEHYGGSNVGNGSDPLTAEQIPAHGREWSLSLTLPPLAALYLEWLP
ncbi:MAG TPA: alpha amylase C-terminal domain-containing protein, partial [Accumulibacter sp.]|nr:alpha amylase C-terminal domain-containing protein [Accumulibacter sp.]